MKGRRILYSLAGAAAVSAALVLAGPASATDPAVCGTAVTSNVTLTTDVSCPGESANAITVAKSGVTIDLGGHTLTPAPGYDGIEIDAGMANVTIENGTIAGASDGIRTVNGADSLVIKNVKITGAGLMGISLRRVAGGLITSNTITGSGIHALRSWYGAGNAFFSNTLVNSGVSNADLYEETGDAVEGNLSWVGGTSSADNFDESYSDQNLYYGNVSTGGCDGFNVYEDADGSVTMTDNGARGAKDCDGFDIYEANPWNYSPPLSTFTGNIATGGTDSSDGFYDNNSVGATWSNNIANRNDGDGFYFDSPYREIITHNTATGNGGDGYYFTGTAGGDGPLSVANNAAWYNSGWGFNSNYAVTGTSNSGSASNANGDCNNVAGCS